MSSFTIDDFLAETDAQEIDWMRPSGAPASLNPLRVDIGFGPDALEIALATSQTAPRMDDVRRLWALRWNRRAAPVLLVVGHEGPSGWEATICGPSDDPAAIAGLDLSQVDRICAAALAAPTASEAKRTLQRLLVGPKDQLIAGLTNQGLFASHELRHGVPARTDWTTALTTGQALLGKTGPDLITGLGYTATAHGSVAQVLSTNGTRHAVAVLLNENELFDRPGQRFGAVSPVTQGLALAQEQNLPWLVVMRGTQIRLYPAKPDIGVGRKGQSETFVELDLALLTDDDAGYLPLLFAPDALYEDGTVASILAASVDHATALGARLRDRVYVDVVPTLAVAVANAMKADTGKDLDDTALHEAYHRTLIILFRLLFVSYAEDRGLLPYQRNPRYTKKALKTLAREFAADSNIQFDPGSYDRWDDLLSVWRAVDDGNREWDVPAYNGGLFAADADLHPSGHAISRMRLTNAEIGPALKHLLIDTGNDGDLGPVDFRSLSVREFGTIYEGLLESSLSVAPTDLTVDPTTKAYLPATKGAKIDVGVGAVYFHNASGARKATGSYFTKAFAVEHLLDSALEPALTEHLTTVQALLDVRDEAGAAEKFFDFRVADLAMGSGHFLVAAIDRIENRFAKFLTENPIPAVNDELTRLAQAAAEHLGEGAAHVEIEPSMLLRRQIARRCIYGLDLNLMAVELARLGIWIHTFVPGLPMSSLDHGLRVGNSLTGVGTVDEALTVFEPKAAAGQYSLFSEQIEEALVTARDRLLRVARTAEATKAEVREAARAHARAMEDAADAKALLDAAIAVRLGEIPLPTGPEDAIEAGRSEIVQSIVALLQASHMPYLFPEVFLRERPGFDVLLGNPPWEKIKVDEPEFWELRHPPAKSLPLPEFVAALPGFRKDRPDIAGEYESEVVRTAALRRVLANVPYATPDGGDIDLSKHFAGRNWQLVRDGGRCGILIPRTLLSGTGTTTWRRTILGEGEFTSVVTAINTSNWVFDDVEPRYTVCLTVFRKGVVDDAVATMSGPFQSLAEFRGGGKAQIPAQVLLELTETAAFPAVSDAHSAEIFTKMAASPRFDDEEREWRFKPLRELDTALSKRFAVADTGPGAGTMPIYGGASFNLWNSDTGSYHSHAKTSVAIEEAMRLLKSGMQRKRSAYADLNLTSAKAENLPCMRPRLAFRRIARATDTRTFVCTLLPPQVLVTNTAPTLLRTRGSDRDEAWFLGIAASIPFDWFARRIIEFSVAVDSVNALPVPAAGADHPLRRRVTEIAGRMAAVDRRFADWAAEVGVPVASITDETTKDDLIAELDAVVSLLYGLDRADVEHVFETFHRGWNYQSRLDAVLVHYDTWKMKGN